MSMMECTLYSIACPNGLPFPFGVNMIPIGSSGNLSNVSLPLSAPCDNLCINNLFQGPGIGSAQPLALSLWLRLAPGILLSDKGTGFIFWATHLNWALSQAAVVISSELHCAESTYKEQGCI